MSLARTQHLAQRTHCRYSPRPCRNSEVLGSHRCISPGGSALINASSVVTGPLICRKKHVSRSEIGESLRQMLINVHEIFGKIQREDSEHITADTGSPPQVRHVTARGPSPCNPQPQPRHATAATIEHLTTLGERREIKLERADHRQEPDGGSPRGAAPPHRAMTPDCPMSPGEQDSPDLICK